MFIEVDDSTRKVSHKQVRLKNDIGFVGVVGVPQCWGHSPYSGGRKGTSIAFG
jgi:hypothetical protein